MYEQEELVILRTRYSSSQDNDTTLQERNGMDSEGDIFFNPGARWWRLLNDETRFNFGSEWEKAL